MSTTTWKILYLGAVLNCDFPILEAFFHCRPADNPLDVVAGLFKKHNIPFNKLSNNPDLTVCYGRHGQFDIYQKGWHMGTFEITWDKIWMFYIAKFHGTNRYYSRYNWINLLEHTLAPKEYPLPLHMAAQLYFPSVNFL